MKSRGWCGISTIWRSGSSAWSERRRCCCATSPMSCARRWLPRAVPSHLGMKRHPPPLWDTPPPAMMEHLKRIEREAGRLNQLIGQLLRLSSMESTDAANFTESFHLNALLEKMLPDVEFEAEQRFWQVRLLNHCDCVVQGSPELIYRAIENIVRNAVRYTREQSVVELKLGCEKQVGAAMVTLDVSDCGP